MSGSTGIAHASITGRDIPHIKQALEIIFGDTLGASMRLEVFARMAGFRTYAALRARLETFADINGDPFPLKLEDGLATDKDFFAGIGETGRRRLLEAEETGLVRLVIAALAQARHPHLGDVGLPENASMEGFRRTAQALFHPANETRRATKRSVPTKAALVLSPDVSTSVGGSGSFHVYQFEFRDHRDIPLTPAPGTLVSTTDPSRLAQLVAGRVVYAYSTDDLFTIGKRITAQSSPRPIGYRQIRSMTALILRAEDDAPLKAMAEAFDGTHPEDSDLSADHLAIEWMLDMFLMIESYRELTLDLASHTV